MITGLFVFVGLLGLVVTIVMFSMAYNQYQQFRLKKYMTNEKGFSELLNCGVFYDHKTLVNKNGSVSVMFEVKTFDGKTMTEEEMVLRNNYFNQALTALGSGWTIHYDIRRQISRGSYPTKEEVFYSTDLAKAVDQEQREKFEEHHELFENVSVLTLTYTPDLLVEQKFTDLIFAEMDVDKADQKNKSKGKKTKTSNDRASKIMKEMHNKLQEFMTLIAGGVTEVRQLGVYEYEGVLYSEILEHLQFCINGSDAPMLFPATGLTSIDSSLSEDFYTGIVPYIGDRESGNYIKIIAIDGFPDVSYPDILSTISLLPLEYRWSSRFITLDRQQALNEIDTSRKRWRQKERGFVAQLLNNTNPSKVNLDAVSMVEDSLVAVQQVESGEYSYGYYSSNIIVRARTLKGVEEKAIYIAEQIRLKGFKARIESVNTIEAFLGSIPSHNIENVRRPLICTINFADFLPIGQLYEGSRFNPCNLYPPFSPALLTTVTEGRTPFHLNIHVEDVGHLFIGGRTGSGKSFLLSNLAIALSKYQNMQINVFDVGNSMMPLCHAMNGVHQPLSIGADDTSIYIDSNIGFNPVGVLIHTTEGRSWLLENFFDAIFTLNGLAYTPEVKKQIKSALDLALKNVNDGTGSADLSEICFTSGLEVSYKNALENYLKGEPIGHFFDSDEDSFKDSNFRVWDMERIMNMSPKIVIPLLMYLFFRIEMSIKRGADDNDGKSQQPSVIIIDETWVMLKDPFFAGKIEDWLRTLRRYNCAVIMATQNIAELEASGMLGIIIESCPTKIYLPNPNISSSEELKNAYQRTMGLSDKDVSIISNARQKKEYYAVSNNGKGKFALDVSHIASAICSSNKEKNKYLTALLKNKENEPNWLYEYLYFCISENTKRSGNYDTSWIESYLVNHGIKKGVSQNEE